MQQRIDAVALHAALLSGYRNLKKNMTAINDLNVFPVPDGDTGTNMVHTFGGGLNAVDDCGASVGAYMQRLAHAVLLNARGNSGVIFSQFIHGLSRGWAQCEQLCFADFAAGFVCATEDAYRAIITPTEGTMLTVIREASGYLSDNAARCDDVVEGMQQLVAQMKVTLAKTPQLLEVLRQAGVVDSGAAGLVCVFEGILAHFCGESIEDTPGLDVAPSGGVAAGSFGPDSVLEYGYCTEFILQLMHAKTDIAAFSRDAFVAPLEQMGDSIVAVAQGSIVKIHIHTFEPEKVLGYARQFGELVTVKIENMSVQHSEAPEQKKEHMKYAVVTVASGQGIVDYFYEIGANFVIDGGQTDNPPVEAFLTAFRQFDAEHIVVLPNNSNIVLTARQAAEMYKDADVRVLPTRSVVEGYSALSLMNPWCETVEELIREMGAGLQNVVSAAVTTATRDAVIGDVAVKKDRFVGLIGKEIRVCACERNAVTLQLIASVTEQAEKDVIIVFYGKNVDESEAQALREQLEARYPLADIGLIDGKQEIYDYIISLE